MTKLWEFKKKVDPRGILNPGKVFPPSLDRGSPITRLNQLIRLGHRFSGLLCANVWGWPSWQYDIDSDYRSVHITNPVTGHEDSQAQFLLPYGETGFVLEVDQIGAIGQPLQDMYDDGVRIMMEEGTVEFLLG